MGRLRTWSIILLMALNIFYEFGETSEENATNMYRLNNVKAEEAARSLEEIYAKSQIKPTVSVDKRTNSLIITASPDIQQELKVVIEGLDQKRRQIVVRAKVIEITSEEELGDVSIDWEAEGLLQDEEKLEKSLGKTLEELPKAGLCIDRISEPEAIEKKLKELLEGAQRLNVLSAPSITVLDREEGAVEITEDMPYMEPVEEEFYRLKGKRRFVPVGYKLFRRKSLEESERPGIKFTVKPVIVENEQIRMDINLRIDEVWRRLPFPEAPNLEVGKPVVNTWEISTSMVAKNGEMVVLGGLIREDTEATTKGKSRKKCHLLYFVQPKIVESR